MKLLDLVQRRAVINLGIGDYGPIRSTYKDLIAGAIREYLYSDNVKITRFKNAFKIAITGAFFPAFETGYQDGGAELPIDPEDVDYVNGRVDGEFAYVDDLFNQLRDLKKEGQDAFEGVPESKAEGYARTLDGIYNQGRIRGAKNRMLTLGGDDGVQTCNTCQKLKGQRHRASWWINRGLVPSRGNTNYDCGGYNCQHFLYDDAGDVFTL